MTKKICPHDHAHIFPLVTFTVLRSEWAAQQAIFCVKGQKKYTHVLPYIQKREEEKIKSQELVIQRMLIKLDLQQQSGSNGFLSKNLYFLSPLWYSLRHEIY